MHTHVGLMQAIDIFTELALDEELVIGDDDYNSFLIVTNTSLTTSIHQECEQIQLVLYLQPVPLQNRVQISSEGEVGMPLHLLPRH